MMNIISRMVGGVVILDCSGRITLGEGTQAIRNTVREQLKQGNKRIILNLAEVNYVDSSGIGELFSSNTTVRNQGGKLKMSNLTKKIEDNLHVAKLDTEFQIYEHWEAALASF